MIKSISILFAVLIVSGFLFLTFPNKAQADQGEYVLGCCQLFFDKKPGCIYPSTLDDCAGGKMKGAFLEGERCNVDSGFCLGNKKDELTSSEQGQ